MLLWQLCILLSFFVFLGNLSGTLGPLRIYLESTIVGDEEEWNDTEASPW